MALNTNLVSYWKLDESSGNAADSFGSNTLTNNNGTTYTTGKLNNAANFGTGNFAVDGTILSKKNLSVTGISDITTNITISAWIKLNEQAPNDSNTYGLVSFTRNTTKVAYNIGYKQSGGTKTLLFNYDKLGTSNTSATKNIDLFDGLLHHVVYVYNSSFVTGYLDGVSIGTSAIDTGTGGSGGTFPDQEMLIGALRGWNYPAGQQTYTSSIIADEVALWSRALSASDISILYNSGYGSQYPFGPLVNTSAITELDTTSVTMNGEVISDSGSIITERGFVYSLTTNPTIANTKVTVAGTIGSYSYNVIGLNSATTYYLKAFATNAQGTSYGSEVSFTTTTLDSDVFYKNIGGVEGETYAVSVNVTGTVGTVTVKLGSTGTSQVIAAGAGVTVFSGVYNGLTGLIFEKSDNFDGTVDDIMWVLVVGGAIIDWTADSLTNVFPIDSSVKFQRVENKNITQFELYRYLDVLFKDLDGYVTLTLSEEENDTTADRSKTFVVGNTSGTASPFVKKKISMLSKNQALIVKFSNANLNETFTVCQYSLSGSHEPSRLYKLSKIISV